MNGKFIVYALLVSFVSTIGSWNKLLSSPGIQSGSGSSWSSSSGSRSSWGGSHK